MTKNEWEDLLPGDIIKWVHPESKVDGRWKVLERVRTEEYDTWRLYYESSGKMQLANHLYQHWQILELRPRLKQCRLDLIEDDDDIS